jgi:hypothetical protein
MKKFIRTIPANGSMGTISQGTGWGLATREIAGWTGVGLIALSFAALYLLNYLVPLAHTNYTTRIWDWTLITLSIGAGVVITVQWRAIRSRSVWIGGALGLVSGLSKYLNDPSLPWTVIEGIAVWLTFIAGMLLFQRLNKHSITAFLPPWTQTVRSLGIGILFAIPLAVLNNMYFYLQNGTPQFRNILVSSAEALSPGIHEEIVFRYFILALCFTLLQHSSHRRLVIAAGVALAVIPHSLLHLPDLFLENPGMALGLLAATSLLFGLPMAILQIRRNLETAIAFHWFIDFIRFVFGF